MLTHWGRVTHISVGNLTKIGSCNGLSPARRQAIIWTNDGILSIGTLGTFFKELIEIRTFSLKQTHLEMSSAKCSFRLGLNVLTLFYQCGNALAPYMPVPYIYWTFSPPCQQMPINLTMLRENNINHVFFQVPLAIMMNIFFALTRWRH